MIFSLVLIYDKSYRVHSHETGLYRKVRDVIDIEVKGMLLIRNKQNALAVQLRYCFCHPKWMKCFAFVHC